MEFLKHYIDSVGMSPINMITTIFGAFCVAFTVIICWGKLVEDFGPAGGMLCAAIIVGTFWVMNHKLPGFGINPEGLKDTLGVTKQFGLVFQGFQGGAPWIDMGASIAMGLWVTGIVDGKPGQRGSLIVESAPRVLTTILGGILGGGMVGLLGYTNANLFGYK